ncbi:hypothetical protein Nepgr_007324 [Nepenthes gracilis]|uniref:Homeobox domain-containing protein n=1 Tax=Nepenthes gracilis TaxID=150966 RepID=A0AAD3S6Y8_NEPGR|nr:hypothetical protein Nepgr_007324 [Nepenthes gracilis]
MGSSNRHWPSMFKSKPHHLQRDSRSSLTSSACRVSPHSSVGAECEERSHEPKPRWNPKPEQIRVLEAIFNSGMVNPSRDEIRKIRAKLQEYGQVGDANVFYWFQNRKSRSKHKQRHLQNSKQNSPAASVDMTAATISPPSSSDKSSPKGSDSMAAEIIGSAANNMSAVDVSDSPTASVYQTYFQTTHNEYLQDPFLFPVQQKVCGIGLTAPGTGFTSQGLCLNDLNDGAADHQRVGTFSSLLLGEIVCRGSRKEDDEKLEFPQAELSFIGTNPPTTNTIAPTAVTVASLPPLRGKKCELSGSPKSMAFINDVAFQVPACPFNVRDAFGEDALLLTPSGHPVLTNEWGVTLHPLQNGAFYYLMRTSATPLFEKHGHTSDLIASEFPYQI